MAAAVAAGSGVAGAAQQQQPSGEPLLTDPNVIIRRYQAMQQECQALAGKVQELEMELGEHELVVKQLTPLDGGRRAFRLANGVLMERTVAEVLPDLTGTAENLKLLLQQVGLQLERKQRETLEWKEKYKIRAQTAQEIQSQQQKASQEQAAAAGGGGAGGVLA